MMFINHQKSAKAAKDYYTQHIAPGDGKYYTNDSAQQLKGVWHGRAAEKLLLSGEVRQEDFFKLCDNVNPATGERLTMRSDADRRVLTDITFDVPKSVTLAYELGGDDRILDAFRNSLRETMAEMEAGVQTRVRKKGADHDRTTGNLIWAEHIHKTARPVTTDDKQTVDPHLHAHATVFNATYDDVEKRWKAIQLGDIVRDKGYYQAAFHARMAAKLKELDYSIRKDGNSFKLAGISRETVDKFSQRHRVINEEAGRRGVTDGEGKAKIARRSREKKSPEPQSMEALREEWDSRLMPQERLSIRNARHGWDKSDLSITPEEAKAYAIEHSFERASTVSEKRMKEEALKYAVGSVTPDDVADIAQHPEVIAREWEGQRMTTTKAVMRAEVAMLQFAKDGQRKFRPLVSDPERLNEALAGLSGEQRKAALHPLTSRDQVVGIRGGAGTGKTHMMQTVNAVITGIESGQGEYHRVHAFAPSSTASRGELRKVGFKNADTLASLFNNEKMQAQVHRQVVLIDEAGQLSTKDMRRLFDIAGKQEARVILVGDYRQHSSVEAGDAFRVIEKEAGIRYAELTEVRRQTTPAYRKAVERISAGTGADAQKGFDALCKMGWVVEASAEDRHRALVNDYCQASEDGKSALIIAPTHAEGDRLTEELREVLKERGNLGREHRFIARKAVGWTDAQKGDVRNYEPGLVLEWHQNAKGFRRGEKAVVVEGKDGLELRKQDGSRAVLALGQVKRFDVYRARELGIAKGDRIRITRNGAAKVEGQAKGIRLNNGDIFTVAGFTKDGDINLGRGRYLPKGWGHMSLGYVDTSYASQGKTVDRVFIATGQESLAASNQQQWYVSVSRGREMAKIYVDSKKDVRAAIGRAGERLSAVELTKTKLAPSWRRRFSESLERNRVGRFLKRRAQALQDYWRGREGVTYA